MKTIKALVPLLALLLLAAGCNKNESGNNPGGGTPGTTNAPGVTNNAPVR